MRRLGGAPWVARASCGRNPRVHLAARSLGSNARADAHPLSALLCPACCAAQSAAARRARADGQPAGEHDAHDACFGVIRVRTRAKKTCPLNLSLLLARLSARLPVAACARAVAHGAQREALRRPGAAGAVARVHRSRRSWGQRAAAFGRDARIWGGRRPLLALSAFLLGARRPGRSASLTTRAAATHSLTHPPTLPSPSPAARAELLLRRWR
jgi:hypothetical protein